MLAKDVPNLVKESFQITAEAAGHKISVTSFLRVVASILLSDIYIVLFMLLHTSIHIKMYLHKQYVGFHFSNVDSGAFLSLSGKTH